MKAKFSFIDLTLGIVEYIFIYINIFPYSNTHLDRLHKHSYLTFPTEHYLLNLWWNCFSSPQSATSTYLAKNCNEIIK